MERVYQSKFNTIWKGDARDVAAAQPDGSFSLAILDGPYGMRKAHWDMMKVADLPKWYAPFLDDVGRLCAPSASLYVWNTAEGWAALHPAILERGWVFRSLITWHKPAGNALRTAHETGTRCWPDVTEVCGFYQREEWAASTAAGATIAYAAGADDRNWVRQWLRQEWSDTGLRWGAADVALGTKGMAGHYFNASQWCLPTWEAYQKLAAYAAEHGAPRARPYLVHASVCPDGDLRASYDHLRAAYDHLRASYDHLRAEYEASRPAFNPVYGLGNVWRRQQVMGADRLTAPNGETLHPCQKPVEFAERMIRASSRPGERVWVPFGGTCREAVAAECMGREEPSDARVVVTAELDQDGRNYLDAVVEQIEGRPRLKRSPLQVGLFG